MGLGRPQRALAVPMGTAMVDHRGAVSEALEMTFDERRASQTRADEGRAVRSRAEMSGVSGGVCVCREVRCRRVFYAEPCGRLCIIGSRVFSRTQLSILD